MKVLFGLVIGVVFGITLSWTRMVDPDVIRGALLFEDAYLFLFFAAAVGTAAIGTRVVAHLQGVELPRDRPERRHVVGSLVFGLGWGVSGACPGPIAAQLGQGVPWAIFTMTGAVLGVWLFLRRGEAETEPASDGGSAAQGPVAVGARR